MFMKMQHKTVHPPAARIRSDAHRTLAADFRRHSAAPARLLTRLLARAKGRPITIEDLRWHAREMEILAARLEAVGADRSARRVA